MAKKTKKSKGRGSKLRGTVSSRPKNMIEIIHDEEYFLDLAIAKRTKAEAELKEAAIEIIHDEEYFLDLAIAKHEADAELTLS